MALSRLCSILHFAVSLPMRWLAGKTHTLASDDWSVASMSRAIDCFFEALIKIKIEKEPEKFLDENFMMSIFEKLNLEKLNEHMRHIFESRRLQQ